MGKRLYLLVVAMIAIVYTSSAQLGNQTDSVITQITELDEVVIKAMLVRHDSHSDEYRIISPL